jgi:hypothetical protein
LLNGADPIFEKQNHMKHLFSIGKLYKKMAFGVEFRCSQISGKKNLQRRGTHFGIGYLTGSKYI